MSFVTDKWWALVTGNKDRGASVSCVDRRYFELCVFSNVMLELKSGHLCIPGSDQFSDYHKELISEDEFERWVALYGEQAGIPAASKGLGRAVAIALAREGVDLVINARSHAGYLTGQNIVLDGGTYPGLT